MQNVCPSLHVGPDDISQEQNEVWFPYPASLLSCQIILFAEPGPCLGQYSHTLCKFVSHTVSHKHVRTSPRTRVPLPPLPDLDVLSYAGHRGRNAQLPTPPVV